MTRSIEHSPKLLDVHEAVVISAKLMEDVHRGYVDDVCSNGNTPLTLVADYKDLLLKVENTEDPVRNIKVCLFADMYAAVKRAPHMLGSSFRETDLVHSICMARIIRLLHNSGLILADQHVIDSAFSYALVHDATEVVNGDTPTIGLDDEAMREKAAQDEKALNIFKSLFNGTTLLQYVDDYERASLPAAQVVRLVDKAMPSIANGLNLGRTLRTDYGIVDFRQYIDEIRATNRKIVGYGWSLKYPSWLQFINECRVFCASRAFDCNAEEARDYIYARSIEDGMSI